MPENRSTSFKTCFSAKSPGANGLKATFSRVFELLSFPLVKFQTRLCKWCLEPFIRHVHSKTTAQRLSELIYKTCFYANLPDVSGNSLYRSNILTHDHLSINKIKVSNSFRLNDRKKSHKKCTKTTNRLMADIGKTVFT